MLSICSNIHVAEDELTNRREVLNLLQLSELKLLCKDLKMPTSLQRCQKSEIINAFFTHAQQHKPLFGTSSLLDVVFKRCQSMKIYMVLYVSLHS